MPKSIPYSYSSAQEDSEQILQLMKGGNIAISSIIDDSSSIESPAATFEAFRNSKICKLNSQFED